MRVLVTVSIVLFFKSAIFSQNILPIGQWRSHLSSSSSITSALVGTKIYSGANSSFFYYDIVSGETKSLSKLDGFAQSNVSYLAYSESAKTLVIAYENSQMDLLTDAGNIYRMNDIFNAKVTGSKTIKHILVNGNIAYISTGFGLVVLDISKRKVLDAYQNFDNDVLIREALETTILNDTIYLATTNGVYFASLAKEVNKLDYASWTQIPNLEASHLIAFEGRLYFASKNTSQLDTIYIYQNGSFQKYDSFGSINAYKNIETLSFSISGNKLWVTKQNNIFSFYKNICKLEYSAGDRIFSPRDVISIDENIFWVSDERSGLVKVSENTGVVYGPNGPSLSIVFRFSHSNTLVVSGGYDVNYTAVLRDEGFALFKDGIWSNYSPRKETIPKEFADITSSVYNEVNKKYYLTSWTRGIMEWDGNKEFKVYNQDTPGCKLQSCSYDFCSAPGAIYCRVSDMDVDSKGDMWILNPTPDASRHNVLFKYGIDGSWENYVWSGIGPLDSYNYSSEVDAESPHYYVNRIHVDKNDNKWMACRSGGLKMGGLMVFNEKRYSLPRYLNYTKGTKEEICGSKVNCIKSDLNGAVWIGTDNGVCYFTDPNEVLQRKAIKASVPVFENRALLKGQNITAIDVDGSNRKWIGTESGVWLFSSDGTKLVSQFDISNSPIPSNKIIDIKVDQKSGEVFIATEGGMISYGGNSIVSDPGNSNISIYPNPVKPDFDGYLSIGGLVNNAIVKITDISGKLVFQTKAEGGLASWNVKDYLGRRPLAGVYLVFSFNEDGSESFVSKLAILD
jgi:ligand-binding sensor domain-containing protein